MYRYILRSLNQLPQRIAICLHVALHSRQGRSPHRSTNTPEHSLDTQRNMVSVHGAVPRDAQGISSLGLLCTRLSLSAATTAAGTDTAQAAGLRFYTDSGQSDALVAAAAWNGCSSLEPCRAAVAAVDRAACTGGTCYCHRASALILMIPDGCRMPHRLPVGCSPSGDRLVDLAACAKADRLGCRVAQRVATQQRAHRLRQFTWIRQP